MRCTCPECGQTYSGTGGGHCRGGAYGGCCKTFANDTAGDAHRAAFRCLDVEREPGWRNTPRGWTNSPPMSAEARARLRNRPAEPQEGTTAAIPHPPRHGHTTEPENASEGPQ